MRVVQSHGRQDPLLPYSGAETLRDLLLDAGVDLQFVPFDGQHEIPLPVLLAFRDLLLDLLAGRQLRAN
jgi:phospholipase/carboxylesterase